MATVQFYIGTCGPYLIEDDHPLYTDLQQVALKADVETLKITEYITGTDTPTGKKFKIRKYDDGTFAWEEL